MQTLSTNNLTNVKSLYKTDYLACYEMTLEQIKNHQYTLEQLIDDDWFSDTIDIEF
ncbi:hypothetical protein [Anabaena sp. UHCC 0451]|uniref:hypothetical protein n=1 Tax=Anabaena sp. UHCC 0451 TaxID=2055235 RepID=UPI002B2163E3|nr:hypothetical protein [Anabaena sp. UHCC 0451]MEA5579282.1 hypothetical protein [Anabaena sp. UHCC 0451]